MYFHEKVCSRRQSLRMTQQELAVAAGVSLSTVVKCEEGQPISLLIAQKFGGCLGICLNTSSAFDRLAHIKRHDTFDLIMDFLAEELDSSDKDYFNEIV